MPDDTSFINENYNLPTPTVDALLLVHTLKTKEGYIINDTLTKGQKLIMECIVTRRSPDPAQLNRIQIETITRYGKSMCIGAALAMRASGKKEPWAVVAPTQDKAQIIMDYAIQFATNDPLMKGNLMIAPPEMDKIDKLKEHKAKDHVTFKRGGEIRAFTAGQKSSNNKTSGDALMGFGCPNVIEDECYLIDDNTHSKVLRMLGDNPHNNFLMKIGNPFNRGHAYESRNNPSYFRLILDFKVALIEKRLSLQLLEEMRHKPNFSVLYECLPPDSEAMDDDGYFPMFSDSMLKNAYVEAGAIKGFGKKRSGCDISDGGENESVICDRWENLAQIAYEVKGLKTMDFGTQVAVKCEQSNEIFLDGTGVGAGVGQMLERHQIIGEKVSSVKVGDKSSEPEKFFNLRAELFWKAKEWIASGGKLVRHPKWEQLLHIKYKVTKQGTIQIISKDELRKKGIPSPDHADSFSLTFSPTPPAVSNMQGGGIAGMANAF
mgnify:CR=1 FL=1